MPLGSEFSSSEAGPCDLPSFLNTSPVGVVETSSACVPSSPPSFSDASGDAAGCFDAFGLVPGGDEVPCFGFDGAVAAPGIISGAGFSSDTTLSSSGGDNNSVVSEADVAHLLALIDRDLPDVGHLLGDIEAGDLFGASVCSPASPVAASAVAAVAARRRAAVRFRAEIR